MAEYTNMCSLDLFHMLLINKDSTEIYNVQSLIN